MCSDPAGGSTRGSGAARRRLGGLSRVVALALPVVVVSLLVPLGGASVHFFPDDPISVDHDDLVDASGLVAQELSEAYDFIENTFVDVGDRRSIRALNVNTLDEVPDSSWFTNRIGIRPMSAAEITRGPDEFERLDVEQWTVIRGKTAGAFQPGFLATSSSVDNEIYQLEVDPEDYPDLATGAELIGTAVYHALGYNVVQNYLVEVAREDLVIAEEATIRDASGRRAFTEDDLDDVLRGAARLPSGRYRMTASRFAAGSPLGQFRYFGTRPDDPNDIVPHEHRRELRANRVFTAWLNHDDSRAINTLDVLVERDGRQVVQHYMFDFGSTLGSATRFPDNAQSGREYFLEKRRSLLTLATLGLYVKPWLRIPELEAPPSVGRFTGQYFDPASWRAEYPNAAFENMRPDDAFWGARLVSAFSNEAVAAAVRKAAYQDPRATLYMTQALIARRDRIRETWLNGVNPLVDLALDEQGRLSFVNAAVEAGAATADGAYELQWRRFDNLTGPGEPVGPPVDGTATAGYQMPAALDGDPFVMVSIVASHPEHPAWSAHPLLAYFRRSGAGWQTVGLERTP